MDVTECMRYKVCSETEQFTQLRHPIHWGSEACPISKMRIWAPVESQHLVAQLANQQNEEFKMKTLVLFGLKTLADSEIASRAN